MTVVFEHKTHVENSIEEENESKSLRIMFASQNVHLQIDSH